MNYLKYFSPLLFLIICITSFSQKKIVLFPEDICKRGGYKMYDSIYVDLNKDRISDTIFIYKIEPWDAPGDFHRIVIHYSSSNNTLEINNMGDWKLLDTERDDKTHLNQSSIINSNKFIITDITQNLRVLILKGYSFASSPGRLTIIDLNNIAPKILFDDLTFKILKIEDLDKDQIAEIIGLDYFGQCIHHQETNKEACTYVPYFVLKYDSGKYGIDTALSETYNYEKRGNYFGLKFTEERYYTVGSSKEFLFEYYRKYPFTSKEFLKAEDLENYSKKELRIIRNEIFAFHGYIFDSDDLREYFEAQYWYKPKGKNVLYRLNKFEKHNIKLIKELENRQ